MSEYGDEVEAGRYRVVADGQGSWWLYRATGLCETCQGCGCGEKAAPVEVPDLSMGMMAVMGWMARNGNKGIMGQIGGMISGPGSNGSSDSDGTPVSRVRRAARRVRNGAGTVGHADQEAGGSRVPEGSGAAGGVPGGG